MTTETVRPPRVPLLVKNALRPFKVGAKDLTDEQRDRAVRSPDDRPDLSGAALAEYVLHGRTAAEALTDNDASGVRDGVVDRVEPLAVAEAQSFVRCEAIIERGMRTFAEVGNALVEIRDGRLYRETHASFEAYCRERWQMGKPQAHRVIVAAEVAEVAAAAVPTGTAPANEAVARELAPLREQPEQLREAWSEAVEEFGEQPTAAQVHGIVERRAPRPTREDGGDTKPREVIVTPQEGSEVRVSEVIEAWATVLHGVRETARVDADVRSEFKLTVDQADRLATARDEVQRAAAR